MVSRFVYRTPITAPYPLATFGAIVVVSGHRHSHVTSGDSRVRGLVPGELVNEHVDGRGFDLLEIEGGRCGFVAEEDRTPSEGPGG